MITRFTILVLTPETLNHSHDSRKYDEGTLIHDILSKYGGKHFDEPTLHLFKLKPNSHYKPDYNELAKEIQDIEQ